MGKDRMHLLDNDGKYACIKAFGIASNLRATTQENLVTCGNCKRILKKIGYKKEMRVSMKRGKEPLIFIDGVAYRPKKMTLTKIDGDVHDGEVIYEKVKEETEEKLDYIKEQLKSKVEIKDVLDEIMRPMTTNEINRIYKILKEKKPKITTQKGCLTLKIDGGKHNTAHISLYD